MSTSLQNYNILQAAELLGCKPRYLEDNLKRLPHQKIGASVVFDEDEIAEIKAMHRVRPASAQAEPAPAPISIAHIQPKRRRRAG
ncbi:hypothetical protein [Streptomyces sp. NPDC096153]|uniref:hypothetical protein n=1 Tax=Streptomyces sp. NPDC096153 TaxID=3155548 RepID=UPI00333078E3